MNLLPRSLLTTALLVLAAVAAPAQSQDLKWYGGLGVGQSKAKDICTAAGGAGVRCDETALSYKLFGGYQFNRNWGAEVGYTDLGKVKAESAAGSVEFSSKGFEFLGVGTYPFNDKWAAYAKLGLFSWGTDLKDGTAGGASASARGNDFTYGFGVKYDFSKTFAVRVEYQQYNDIGDLNTTAQADIGVLGINVLFRF